MQHSSLSPYFPSFGSNILRSAIFSNTMVVSLKRGANLHPRQETDELFLLIIVLPTENTIEGK
jgi:hypothetical protein